jgi:putative endonuclease
VPWFVYIIQSDTTGRLYTGITTDPDRRLQEHNGGSRGAKYTRTGRPWKRVFLEPTITRLQAIQREYEIKGFSRKRKLSLIESHS